MVENTVEPVFSSESSSNDLQADRPVRISGFFTLVLGIISGCAIFAKALLVIPLLTLVVAAFALRPSHRGVPVGRTAAFAGVILAVFFGTWGWFKETTRDQELRQQAARFAQYWLLTLQQGDTELAVELASPPAERQSEEMPLETFYQRSEKASESLQQFLERPVIAAIIAHDDQLKWELDGRPVVTHDTMSDRVSVRLKETSGAIENPVQIALVRQRSEDAEPGEWFVSDFQFHYPEAEKHQVQPR